MKPYIAEILEHNGKTFLLPMPAKYRELLDCAAVLGIKDEEDEYDVRRTGYKSLIVPAPDCNDARYHVERAAAELSKLSEKQVRAIGALCDAFSLPFGDIMGVLAYIYPNLREA
jgi:hypothetical protein